MTGIYLKGSYRGFMRAANGKFKSFEPKGATGTFAAAINRSGTIAGSDFYSGTIEEFVRTK